MKIAVLSDFHFFGMADSNNEVLEARDCYFGHVLNAFFGEDADYFVALGDLTHAGTPDEFMFVMDAVRERGLRGKFLHILGNHELKRLTKSEALVLTGQPRYHAIDRADARLVFLDTSVEKASNGDLDEEQLEWFRQQVRGTGAKPLVVFAHHPVYDTTPRSTEGGGRTTVRPSIDMKAILSLHEHEGLYVNGHIHINSIVRKRNWSFVQTTSLLDAPGYRLIEISDQALKVNFVHLQGEELEQLRLYVAGHTSPFRFNDNALGQESDRELFVSRHGSGRRQD